MKNLLLYKATLAYATILNFLSGFGQTFFISIFVPAILIQHSLSEAEFGRYFSGLTLVSAALLPWSCRHLERLPWRYSSSLIIAGMAFSAFLLSYTNNFWLMWVAIFGLRYLGQGLTGHISSVSIVKNVPIYRATALSLASTGFPLSESFLPVLAYLMLQQQHWQKAWNHYSIVLWAMVLFLFALGFLLDRKERIEADKNWGSIKSLDHIFTGSVLKEKRFLLCLPAILCLPFFVTGLFLYQTSISLLKGWDIQQMSVALSAFALGRLLFALLFGPVIDYFSAKRLFSFHLVPFAIALLFLSYGEGLWAAWAFMLFTGISAGVSGTLKSTLWTELFGAQAHGRFRAVAATLMVFATAIAPFVFGEALGRSVDLDWILHSIIVLMILASLPPFIYFNLKKTTSA